MAKTILEMKGISKSYGGIKALKDVKIELYEGEILCQVLRWLWNVAAIF